MGYITVEGARARASEETPSGEGKQVNQRQISGTSVCHKLNDGQFISPIVNSLQIIHASFRWKYIIDVKNEPISDVGQMRVHELFNR